MRISDTILEQLGGNKFIACTGCHTFISGDNWDWLQMCIPRNGSKANRLTVKYNHDTDTYNMRFWRYTGGRWNAKKYTFSEPKITDIKVYNEIYNDQLQELFTEVTGMHIPSSITINGRRFG